MVRKFECVSGCVYRLEGAQAPTNHSRLDSDCKTMAASLRSARMGRLRAARLSGSACVLPLVTTEVPAYCEQVVQNHEQTQVGGWSGAAGTRMSSHELCEPHTQSPHRNSDFRACLPDKSDNGTAVVRFDKTMAASQARLAWARFSLVFDGA